MQPRFDAQTLAYLGRPNMDLAVRATVPVVAIAPRSSLAARVASALSACQRLAAWLPDREPIV